VVKDVHDEAWVALVQDNIRFFKFAIVSGPIEDEYLVILRTLSPFPTALGLLDVTDPFHIQRLMNLNGVG
jgi:hypothetical protein